MARWWSLLFGNLLVTSLGATVGPTASVGEVVAVIVSFIATLHDS